jgi:hypothetical protein
MLIRFAIIRALAILGLLAALAAIVPAESAAKQRLPVIVVRGLELQDLEQLSQRGAVGLLVPAAGPRANERSAEAALVRGKVENSLRGGVPEGTPQIAVKHAARLPREGPAIVLALPRRDQPNNRRYPIAVLAPGYHGLLKSRSTRLPGLVSIVDVVPTALGDESALESRPAEDPVPRLRELDRRIDQNTSTRALTSLVVWVSITLLAFVLPRGALVAFPCALAANLALGVAGISARSPVLVVFALSIVCAAPFVARAARSPEAIGLLCVAVLAGYLSAFALDERWLALSPLSPTQNARFYGLSNLLETFLLVPALAGAAFLGRRHWSLFVGVAVLAVVTVAGSRFGADGGGAVVLAAGYAALATAVARSRGLVLAGAAAGGACFVGLLLAVDELTGSSSHVTRTLRGGPDDLAEALRDRVVLSWERTTDRVLTGLIVSVAILALALLLVRLVRTGTSAPAAALPLAAGVAAGVSLIVNDSPTDVVVTGLVAFLALEAFALPDVSWAGAAARRF